MRMLLHVKLPNDAFNAEMEFHVVMMPEDLARAELDALRKKWS